MRQIMTINDDALANYARLLADNGFVIYEPTGSWGHFVYSRIVDGQECFGDVQKANVGAFGYQHHMPIRPSQENGSSMFVDGVPDELTVEAAEMVARPTNRNKYVGTQKNYTDTHSLERSYIRWARPNPERK